MVRTQIQLTEEQARALKEEAAQRGVPMAELIRQSVNRIIGESEESERWQKALSLIGSFQSGLSDISVNHDRYLCADDR